MKTGAPSGGEVALEALRAHCFCGAKLLGEEADAILFHQPVAGVAAREGALAGQPRGKAAAALRFFGRALAPAIGAELKALEVAG